MPELKKLLKDAFGYIVTDKMVEKVFNEIDTDGSGSLDFGEVLAVRFVLDCMCSIHFLSTFTKTLI